jgi:hypothetical protein
VVFIILNDLPEQINLKEIQEKCLETMKKILRLMILKMKKIQFLECQFFYDILQSLFLNLNSHKKISHEFAMDAIRILSIKLKVTIVKLLYLSKNTLQTKNNAEKSDL